MQSLRSLLFTSFLFIYTPLFGIPVAMSGVLPYAARYALARAWARSVLWMLKRICSLTYSVEGLEEIPPGNYVTLWKHSSAWETISMMVLLPPAVWVLKRELMWIPLVGWGLAALRPIAIDRNAGHGAINQVVEQGTARLAEGLWVVIFPEGTRVAAGEARRYGSSGSLLAMAAHAQIIPVAHNAGDYWPRRGFLKKPGIIRVAFGPPIDPVADDARATNEMVRDWIDSKVAELSVESAPNRG
jgi:1-acyl-sn-glycerol-3-phosphate acyltransferase